jgi:superfamily I DNA and RNA helicase
LRRRAPTYGALVPAPILLVLKPIVGPKRNERAVDQLLSSLASQPWTGRVYVGYPVLPLEDDPRAVDALLLCKEHGVVVFDLADAGTSHDLDALRERQDALHAALHASMLQYRPLVANRQLAVAINVLTVVPAGSVQDDGRAAAGVVTPEDVVEAVARFPGFSAEMLTHVNASIQRINAIRATSKRPAPTRVDSRGAVMQRIEREVANLDDWQEEAAIEAPEGPQRIRGLAGSGKTVVLARKAAYLHAQRPDWRIAVTFSTRSLYQQYNALVERFYYDQMRDKPDPDRLHVLHTWGSPGEPGVYSRMAERAGVPIRNLNEAKAAYGSDGAVAGICGEVLEGVAARGGVEPLYDVLLIDEAQDLPPSFFQLAHAATEPPHRVVFAYDELQNLGDAAVAQVAELFGRGADKKPRVQRLSRGQGVAEADIILPVCYRNTPWALSVAHAIGFGIYRKAGLVQAFDDPVLWTEIGYELVDGELAPGAAVRLVRAASSTPRFFAGEIDPTDAVTCHEFPDADAQAAWVAAAVQHDLEHEDLRHRDLMVVITRPYPVEQNAAPLIKALAKLNIRAHIVGVQSSRDEVFVDGSVAVSGIRRAKGNEAPMVYVLHAEYGLEAGDVARRRNTLFTAITRSRAWVRVCGVGPNMAAVRREVDEVVANDYALAFRLPTADELQRMRRIRRDMSDEERTLLRRSSRELAAIIQAGDPAVLHGLLSALAPDDLERLQQALAERESVSG